MGKLIKTICGLFFILCCTNLYAGPQNLANYPWTLMQVPIWCGPSEEVNKTLEIEGYVEIDKTGGAVKIVDKMEFTFNNFTVAKNWDK